MRKLIIAAFLILGVGPAIGYAADVGTDARAEKTLVVVKRQLGEINKKLDLILKGQNTLYREHSEIKKWIHRR